MADLPPWIDTLLVPVEFLDVPVVRESGPGALTASRERWDGCPYGFHPAHDGPCP